MNNDEHRLQHDQRDWREVFHRIVGRLLHEGHVSGVCRGGDQKRVAVWSRIDDRHGANDRVAASLVFNDDALAEHLR